MLHNAAQVLKKHMQGTCRAVAELTQGKLTKSSSYIASTNARRSDPTLQLSTADHECQACVKAQSTQPKLWGGKLSGIACMPSMFKYQSPTPAQPTGHA